MKSLPFDLKKPFGVSRWIWSLGLIAVAGSIVAFRQLPEAPSGEADPPVSGKTEARAVSESDDATKLRRVIHICRTTLGPLRPGMAIEVIMEGQLSDTRRQLENTALPGKAMVLDRQLTEREASLARQKESNKRAIRKAQQAFEEGDSLVRKGNVEARLRDEYFAHQTHCQRGIDILASWQRDLRSARRAMDLALIRGQGYAAAAEPYDRLLKQEFPELAADPKP